MSRRNRGAWLAIAVAIAVAFSVTQSNPADLALSLLPIQFDVSDQAGRVVIDIRI